MGLPLVYGDVSVHYYALNDTMIRGKTSRWRMLDEMFYFLVYWIRPLPDTSDTLWSMIGVLKNYKFVIIQFQYAISIFTRSGDAVSPFATGINRTEYYSEEFDSLQMLWNSGISASDRSLLRPGFPKHEPELWMSIKDDVKNLSGSGPFKWTQYLPKVPAKKESIKPLDYHIEMAMFRLNALRVLKSRCDRLEAQLELQDLANEELPMTRPSEPNDTDEDQSYIIVDAN